MARQRTINNETCTQIGKGEFCNAYRSKENPDTVYLVTVEGDNVKEILKMIQDTPHIPVMQWIDSYRYCGQEYTIWKTEYSEKLTAQNKEAWKIAKILRQTWEKTTWQMNKDNWYIRCHDFIETLRENNQVPKSIIDALDNIYTWATAYGPNFQFEFPPRNLGVDKDGNLVLRDIVFFR